MLEQEVILIAEDNDDHALLIKRAFAQANVLNPLHFVYDGAEVIAYLKGDGKYSNREEYPLPSLVLLDLKMPRVDGFQVLEWVRQQPSLKTLRVVVLTCSDEIRDVNRAYALGANSFLVKPISFQDFVQLSQAIKGYWIWLSRAPEAFRDERKADTMNS
jgi:CheY-like chemotaxis protein